MSDDTPISPSDAIFARAYASAIKSKFQIALRDNDCILTGPVTQRGIPGGDLIYPQMTNYLIYKFSDALQYSDNPVYTGVSAGSYLQQLRSYLDWLKAQGNPSQVVVDRMTRARDAAIASANNYFTVLKQAQDRFNLVKELVPGQTFWQWSASDYPPLAAAERTRKGAQSELYQAMHPYFGPDATTLLTYMDYIVNAQSANAYPGCNQDGFLEDQDLIDSAIRYANSGQKIDQASIHQSTIRVPAYTIPAYSGSLQGWINDSANGASRDEVIGIDISQGQNTRWEDYGFREVNSGGGVGFWPFFSAEVNVGGEWETRTLDTSGREADISLQLAMIGITRFDIQAGIWDNPQIKLLFPERLPNAPDALSAGFARIVSVLVGYDVELKVEFGPEMREEVNNIYEEVKNTSGRMSIFGFRVSAGEGDGSTDHVVTRFEDVKWDKDTGLMSLTPTPGQVYPTILGAIARRLG